MNRYGKLFYCFGLVWLISCNQSNKVEDVKNDTAFKLSPITHDANDDTIHWALERIDVIIRCRDLHDSANDIYIDYAQGENTYENYLNARKVYEQEYKTVYIPLCDKLGLKPEGGKK